MKSVRLMLDYAVKDKIYLLIAVKMRFSRTINIFKIKQEYAIFKLTNRKFHQTKETAFFFEFVFSALDSRGIGSREPFVLKRMGHTVRHWLSCENVR